MNKKEERFLLEVVQIYQKLSDVKGKLISQLLENPNVQTTPYFEAIENFEGMIRHLKKQVMEEGEVPELWISKKDISNRLSTLCVV